MKVETEGYSGYCLKFVRRTSTCEDCTVYSCAQKKLEKYFVFMKLTVLLKGNLCALKFKCLCALQVSTLCKHLSLSIARIPVDGMIQL